MTKTSLVTGESKVSSFVEKKKKRFFLTTGQIDMAQNN
jgi:hypothetical protein